MNLNSGPKEGIPSRTFQTQSLPDAARSPNPAKPRAWVVLDQEQPPPSNPPLLRPKPSQVPFVFSKTVVCLTKATSPAFSARHLSQESRAGVGRNVPLGSQARGPPLPPDSCHHVPEGSIVAVIPLLAAAHTLVAPVLIAHAERAQRGRVVPRVVYGHAAAIEELAHRWGRRGRM